MNGKTIPISDNVEDQRSATKRLAELFQMCLATAIQESVEFKTIIESAGKMNPLSADNFCKALLNSFSVTFFDPDEKKHGQVFVDINGNRLVDGVVSGIDANTISRSRKRLGQDNTSLVFLSEILEMKDKLRGVFQIDWNDKSIRTFKWINHDWRGKSPRFLTQMTDNAFQQTLQIVKGDDQ